MIKEEFVKILWSDLTTQYLFNVDFSKCSKEEQENFEGLDKNLYITTGESDCRTFGLCFLPTTGKSLIFEWTDLDIEEFPENSEFNIYPQTVIVDFMNELRDCLTTSPTWVKDSSI